MKTTEQHRNVVVRYVFLTIGAISFALGTAGIVLPLLPTVPFYMLTLFCLARGSERLHKMFLASSLYQKTVAAYERDKALTLRTKLSILISVSAIMTIGAYFSQELLPVYQRLYDTLGSTSVPAVGQGGVLPFAVQQLVEGGGEGKGVLPDELVGSDTPGFGVLGIGVERDAGHIEEGGFFGYVAGVGHDTFGLVDEEAEVQVALRRQDVQAGHVKPQ